MAYSQVDICIMACTKGTFASWHAPWGHSHHNMHQGDICIMACTKGTFASRHTQEGIHITAYLQGYICIMSYPQRGHLHHDIPTKSICIMTYPLEGIYTTRFCASPSLQEDICIVVWIRALASSWINLASPSWHGTSVSWKLHLHPCQEAFVSEIKNLNLHHVLFALIEDWHLGQ